MRRKENTLYEVLDQYTGELVTYSKVTTWYDGSAMNDSKCDGIVFKKLITEGVTEYFKRNYTTLYIEHFGGRSDSTFDSFPAFRKYVEFCNNSGCDVYIPEGNYLFKNDGQSLDILVSADFGTANIILDANGNRDFRIYVSPKDSDKFSSTTLTSANENALLEEIERIINNNLVESNNSVINQLKNKYLYLFVKTAHQTPERVESYRLGGDPNPIYYREYFFIDNFGNIQADFYNNNLDLVVDNVARFTLEGYSFNQRRYLRGGKFTAAYTATSEQNFRFIGFQTRYLCNIEIDNIYYDLSQVQNRTGGFIEPVNCFNISITNVSGKPANHTVIAVDSSYTISLTGCTNVNVVNATVPDLHKQDQWGTFVSHYCYNVNISNCVLNRIDSHYRGWNYYISNCKIGSKGFQVSGGGILSIKDTIVYDAAAFLTGRSDYVSEWEGTVKIENCGLYANADVNCGIVQVATALDSNNPYNFHPNRPGYVIPCMGRSLEINNFFISNSRSRAEKLNAKYFVYKYNLYTLDQNIKLPDFKLNNIRIDNVSTQSIVQPNTYNSLQVLQFLSFESFCKVKQGNNGNNLTESSSTAKPLFTPIYNIKFEVSNCKLYETELFTFVRNTEVTSATTLPAVYNASTNKDQMPMFDAYIVSCENVRPFMLAYRSRISIDKSNIHFLLPLSRSSYFVYNQFKAVNSMIYLDNNSLGTIIDTGAATKEDYEIRGCTIDALDTIDTTVSSRLNTFFFGFTGTAAEIATYTPTPIQLHGGFQKIRQVFITDKCREKLNLIRTATNTGGNKPMNIEFLENILLSDQTYICKVGNTASLPVLRNTSTLNGLKALVLSGSTTFKEYTYNATNRVWVDFTDASTPTPSDQGFTI